MSPNSLGTAPLTRAVYPAFSLEIRRNTLCSAGGGVTVDKRIASRTGGRRIVQWASAFLRDHAAEGVRIADLSRLAGVSERALRNAFHREHGCSPKQFDLRARLQGARRALCDVAAARRVTTIASQFGFFELGRFAAAYKRAFGESPSQTIKTHGAAMHRAS
jgi:AraC-like DNA-binding protein